MKNTRKKGITLFGLLMLASAVTFAQAPKKKLQLDGKTYVIQINKDGKDKKWSDDEIKFNMGKFKSGLFGDWGFTSATPYNCSTIDSTSANKIYVFDCTTKPSDKKEIMVWNGTVTGDDIEGTCEVQKNEKTLKSFTFTGTLKQKKVPGSSK